MKIMSRIPAVAVILSTVLVIAGVFAPAAQAAEWMLGAGIVYGSEIEQPGGQVNLYVPLWDQILVGGDATFYATQSEWFYGLARAEATLWELNANGHYIFREDDSLRAYAIGGVNYSSVKIDGAISGIGSFSETDSNVGLNVGAGAQFPMSWGNPYAEAKYVLGDFDQVVIGVGARFSFGR